MYFYEEVLEINKDNLITMELIWAIDRRAILPFLSLKVLREREYYVIENIPSAWEHLSDVVGPPLDPTSLEGGWEISLKGP